MRVVAVVALLFLTVPGASGLLEDPEGDVALWLSGAPAGTVPGGRFQATDLTALRVDEGRDDLTFTFQVASLDPGPEAPLVESTDFVASWDHGRVGYVLVVTRALHATSPMEGPSHFASLARVEPGSPFPEQVLRPEVEVDAAAGTLAVTLPRGNVTDHAGAKPLPGAVLHNVTVAARSSGLLGVVSLAGEAVDRFLEALDQQPLGVRFEVQDLMPDDGVGTYPVRLGGGENHGLGLSVDEPTRASNGEATTMLFVVRLENDQPDPVPVRFRADGVPSGWDVWFPAEGATFEAGEVREVPVLVRMPFVHEHGSRQEFTVRAEHAGDDSVYGETMLGVVFTEVPQPSGHHPRLWLHSSSEPNPFLLRDVSLQDRVVGYMNAQEDHGDDAPLPPTDAHGDEYAPQWSLPLHPGLGMGLDFHVEGTGRLEFPVRTGEQPLTGTRLHGHLVHLHPDGTETVLATVEDDAEAVDLGRDTRHTFTATVTPTPDADRVPYVPRAGLRLDVWLDRPDEVEQTAAILVGVDAALEPGGVLDLPLREYHDEVDASFGDLQALALAADVRDRPVNPGEATLFDVRVQNRGATDRVLDLRLAGDHADWARIQPARVTVLAGGEGVATVVVQVPADARDGEQADLVVEAVGDDGVRALLRLVARVDTATDHEDLTGMAPTASARDSPGASTPVALAVLAAGALAARRRGS